MSDSTARCKLHMRTASSQTLASLDSHELYFDDESLDDILYPKKRSNGDLTLANLYLHSNEHFRELVRAASQAGVSQAVGILERLDMTDSLPISVDMAREVAGVLARIVPNYPMAALPCDLSGLRPLLEKLWRMATRIGDTRLVNKLSWPLFRWYEHHGEYQQARQVLQHLVDEAKANSNRLDEGVHTNNFAFEYLLEERWEEGLRWFQEAVKILDEVGDRSGYQNARANCLLCRFEFDESMDLASIETEIKDIQSVLASGSHWQQRKPYFLAAKVEEARGNLKQAVRFVRKAAARTHPAKSRYHELDRLYLAELKTRLFQRFTNQSEV